MLVLLLERLQARLKVGRVRGRCGGFHFADLAVGFAQGLGGSFAISDPIFANRGRGFLPSGGGDVGKFVRRADPGVRGFPGDLLRFIRDAGGRIAYSLGSEPFLRESQRCRRGEDGSHECGVS